MNGDQFPDLRVLASEIDATPAPLPWWIRWDVIPIVLCLCIAAATAFAIGRL